MVSFIVFLIAIPVFFLIAGMWGFHTAFLTAGIVLFASIAGSD